MVRALRARVLALAMCGIGGFFAQQTVAPQVVEAMQAALAPRGPDARHAKLWERSGLLHARLSIIDPRPLADQPMANARGDVWIIYNGEVYGWEAAAAELRARAPFRTRSDTEFILRGYEAWGSTSCSSACAACLPSPSSISRRGKLFSRATGWGKSRWSTPWSMASSLSARPCARCCLSCRGKSASFRARGS